MTATGTMTSEAKRKLSQTIRELRAYLLEALGAAVETEYRFAIPRGEDAGLDEARTMKRARFEAWLEEQVRADRAGSKGAGSKGAGAEKAKGKKAGARSAADFRREAEKQAAYTLLNRLVMLAAHGGAWPDGTAAALAAVVTGGWDSRGYREFRELAPALVPDDETEGYAFLLQLVFEELAIDLPGLYGPAGVADLVPVRPRPAPARRSRRSTTRRSRAAGPTT